MNKMNKLAYVMRMCDGEGQREECCGRGRGIGSCCLTQLEAVAARLVVCVGGERKATGPPGDFLECGTDYMP